MSDEKKTEVTLSGDSYEADDVFADAEPWSPVETKLVLWSFAAAGILLIVFGYFINKYILS